MNRESLVYTPNSMCIYIYTYVISCFVVITSYLSILVLVKISKSSEQEVEEIEKKYIFLKASIMSIYIYTERESASFLPCFFGWCSDFSLALFYLFSVFVRSSFDEKTIGFEKFIGNMLLMLQKSYEPPYKL